MNATHARPMLAFWLLAVVAAVITSAGLRAESPPAAAPTDRPAPVAGNATPQPVPSALLRPRPTGTLSPILWGSATAAEHAEDSVQVAAPRGNGAGSSVEGSDASPSGVPVIAAPSGGATTGGSGGNQNGGSGDGATTAARPTTNKPDAGHGKGHGRGHDNGHGNDSGGDDNGGAGQGRGR